MDYYIGIDGGGTKTAAVLANTDGEVIAGALAGATNPNSATDEEIKQVLSSIISQLKRQFESAFEYPIGLFAGMSGAAGESASNRLYNIFQEVFPNNISSTIVPDPINALYSGTLGAPGIVQIAGTGSITYGIDSDHRHVRAGGWGYLFGDEGSGYDIGRRAVIAVTQASDGMTKATMLTEALLQKFQTTHARTVVGHIYNAASPKLEIASLSKLVFESYKEKDPLAKTIIEEAAQAMVKQIQTVKQNLFPAQKSVPLVLAGGIFSDKEVMPVILNKLLPEKEFKQIIPHIPPVGGSLVGALSAQREMTASQGKNIRNTIKKYI